LKTIANPVILIPSHQPNPSTEEMFSLRQCQKILGHFPIFLLHPKGMQTSIYQSLIPNLQFLSVAPERMASIAAYNRLMISPYVFNALRHYTHILIHEPDAIVLKNELLFWCEQNFDYIGAPWFNSDQKDDFTLKATGNFGLSLIKLSTVNDLFSKNPRWYSYLMIFRDLMRGLRGKHTSLQKAWLAAGKSGKLAYAADLYSDHCDMFWSYLVPKLDSHFFIAPPEKAIQFAWETHPVKCQTICGNRLPFGVHAWAKYDGNFIRSLTSKFESTDSLSPIDN
jgi:hypothetical protein